MRFNEDQFSRWAGSPSATEAQRIENTETAIRKAISASDELNGRNIRIFAQGSYRNRVNVRADSDVDIAVVSNDSFFWDGPEGATLQSLGYNDATYMYADFRREVGNALRNYFGAATITQGNKAFDVSANTYRVEADVVPFFEYRRFEADASYISGVEMRPQSGGRVINWPEQHYQNGVTKNAQTRRSFKGCVRIIKTLRYMMMADGIASANTAPSFLLECLMYNIPVDDIVYNRWIDEFRSTLAYLYENTLNAELCSDWLEVSELKWLFHETQPWTHSDANAFIYDCWNYIGYE